MKLRALLLAVGLLAAGNTPPQAPHARRATRGIDVNAKAEIHHIIDRIAGAGVAVLMISSELPELIGMSDRIYVMRDGGVAAELEQRDEMSQERIVDFICQSDQVRAPARPAGPVAPAGS
jgi:ABC-type multidrug transport system ATPase subunit